MRLAAEDFTLSEQAGDELISDDFAYTAIHEAGHAVAAAILGVPFDHIDMKPDDERRSEGRLVLRRPQREWIQGGETSSIRLALSGCIKLMAGMAANLRHAGEEADLRNCGASDRKDAAVMSMLIHMRLFLEPCSPQDDGPKMIQAWAWREACLMMANPRVWNAVGILTKQLLVPDRVEEAEVIAFVRQAGVRYRPKSFRAAFLFPSLPLKLAPDRI